MAIWGVQDVQKVQIVQTVENCEDCFRHLVLLGCEMARLQSIVAVVIGVACLVLTQGGYGQSRPLKKIRVGVPSVGMGNIIIFVTKEGKLFEKYGLAAEVITVMGSGIGSKALISGNLDIIPIATPTVSPPI
jgi:ABC-type proline/glycine betaine transport system substrate-binding protein